MFSILKIRKRRVFIYENFKMLSEELLRIVVPIFAAVYFIAGYVWRRCAVARRIGRDPVAPIFVREGAQGAIGRAFLFIVLALALVVVLFSFAPDYYRYLVPIDYLSRPYLRTAGAALCTVSLFLTPTAQAQMGSSWRIGVDEESRAPLVDTGLFRYSRNPVYLSIVIGLIGTLFVLPNALTWATLCVGVVALEVQIRLEEDFLRRRYGEAYRQYCRKVGRWF